MDAKPFSLSIMSFLMCLLCSGSQAAVVGNTQLANVAAVRVSGAPNAYQFDVEVASPDLGCHQYADWWEVLTADGTLVYRRILAHSHADEQPFSRSGGPVKI